MVEHTSEFMRWLPEFVTAVVVVLAAGAETLHMARWRAAGLPLVSAAP